MLGGEGVKAWRFGVLGKEGNEKWAGPHLRSDPKVGSEERKSQVGWKGEMLVRGRKK